MCFLLTYKISTTTVSSELLEDSEQLVHQAEHPKSHINALLTLASGTVQDLIPTILVSDHLSH